MHLLAFAFWQASTNRNKCFDGHSRHARKAEIGKFKMIWLLQLFIFGHVHKWKIIKDGSLHVNDECGRTVKTGQRYILQCEHCGNIKKKDTI